MTLKERIAVRYPHDLFKIEELEEIKKESFKEMIHERICNSLIKHVRDNGNNFFFLDSEYEYQIYINFFKDLLKLEWNIDEKIFVLLSGGWEEDDINKIDKYKNLVNCTINYKIYFSRKNQK